MPEVTNDQTPNYWGQAMGSAGIQSGGNILSQLSGALVNRLDWKHQKRQADFYDEKQRGLMKYQGDLNYGNWEKQFDRQNAYNSPAAQRARMEEAGYNLALAYGKGQMQNVSAPVAGANVGLGASQLGRSGVGGGQSYSDLFGHQAIRNATNVATAQADLFNSQRKTEGSKYLLNVANANLAEVNAELVGAKAEGQRFENVETEFRANMLMIVGFINDGVNLDKIPAGWTEYAQGHRRYMMEGFKAPYFDNLLKESGASLNLQKERESGTYQGYLRIMNNLNKAKIRETVAQVRLTNQRVKLAKSDEELRDLQGAYEKIMINRAEVGTDLARNEFTAIMMNYLDFEGWSVDEIAEMTLTVSGIIGLGSFAANLFTAIKSGMPKSEIIRRSKTRTLDTPKGPTIERTSETIRKN